jgi:DNA-directed RNA polymerase alpha subunit
MEKIIVSCLESRVEANRSIYARFLLGPFTEDYAVTVGTALRRALLSKVKNIAITAIHIQGVTHEFSTIVGVRESVLDLALNFQQIVLRTRTFVRSTTESSTAEGVVQNEVLQALLAKQSFAYKKRSFLYRRRLSKLRFATPWRLHPYGGIKNEVFCRQRIPKPKNKVSFKKEGFFACKTSFCIPCVQNEVLHPMQNEVLHAPSFKFNSASQRRHVSSNNSSVKTSRVHKSDAKTKFTLSGVSKLRFAPQAKDPTLQTSSFEFESEGAQVGYLQMQGPAVVYANDLKLPAGIECVDPTQYIATLSQEGLLVVKFLISKKKTSFNKNNDTLTGTKINTTDLRTCLKDKNELLQNHNRHSFTLPEIGSYTKRLAKTYSYKARFGKKSSHINQSLINVYNPYAKLTTLFSRLTHPELRLQYLLNAVKKNNFFKLRWNNIVVIQTLKELYSLKGFGQSSSKKGRRTGNFFRIFDSIGTPSFSPVRLGADKGIRAISFRPKSRIFASNSRSFDSAICLRNTMFLDPIFNSVFQVNYVVEKDDLCNQPRERIILELWTNGSIHPRQAIHQALFSLISTFSVFRKAFDLNSL